MFRATLSLPARPRGLSPLTPQVAEQVQRAGIQEGLCNLFLHHTSASLLIQENADPDVLHDLEAFLSRLIPDGDPLFRHVAEGADDMPAHLKTALTASSLTVPLGRGRLLLGTWQGIFLWEHRDRAPPRRLTITIIG
ncbi:MAG: YjbQ family protein [Deltaproteobacteria bacterium]|nr:MAG: YjbQ family protein [Deltaproteobacteria bacterium]